MISGTGIWSAEESKPENYPHSELLCFRLMFNVFNQLERIIDFGCGDGYYLNHFSLAGYWNLLGLEGNPSCKKYSEFIAIDDLTKPMKMRPSQVLSLEVGEHIPPQYEQVFIDNLCNNCSSRMAISWAIEGQAGIGHVNCRNNSYVISEIEKRRFKFNIDLTSYIRQDIEMGVNYFRNSLMVFDKV